MIKRSFLNLFLFLFIAIVSFSCTIPLQAIRTGPENPASVPDNFDPTQNVLLVVAIPQLDNATLTDMKSTIKLEEELRKQYPFSYKIVSLKETAEAYSDTTIYRFALLSERRLVKQKGSFQFDIEEGLAYVPGYKATYIDFAFYDRTTGKRFPFSGRSSSKMKFAVRQLTAMVIKASEQKATDKLKGSTASNSIRTGL